MSVVVIDASAAVCWVAPSQVTQAGEALARRQATFIAPELLLLEVRNVVLRLERRSLTDAAHSDAGLAFLADRIEIIPFADQGGSLDAILNLGRIDTLSFFDAVYLDLAMRRGASLASRDGALIAVALRRGLDVIDVR